MINNATYKQTPIGLIPNDWEVMEFGNFAELQKGKYVPVNDEVKKCLELEHFNQISGTINGWLNSSEQKSTKNIFYKGDILFGKLRPYLKKYWLAEFDGVCSSEVWVFKPKKINCNNVFLFYLIQSNGFIQVANVSSGSKMPRADWDYVSSFPFPIPPLQEQQKIASILSTWDSAIDNCQEVIKELKVRNNGLEKLLLNNEKSIVKSNWRKVIIGELGIFFNGLTGKTKVDFGKGKPYIPYLNIFNNGKINNSYYDLVQIHENEKQQKVQYGDILFTVSSETPNEVGMSSVVLFHPDELYLNSFCFGYRLFDFNTLLPEFACYYFRAEEFRNKITALAQGATRFNLSKNQFKKLELELPSLEYQKAISKILDNATEELNKYQQKLETFKLQKKGLMQQLLTGKLRVKK